MIRFTLGATSITTLASAVMPLVGVGQLGAAQSDVRMLLNDARGAAPAICALAAQGIGQGWGAAHDAPAPPLGAAEIVEGLRDSRRLADADIRIVAQSLGAADPCEREIAVRLIGMQPGESVGAILTEQLRRGGPEARASSAMGLGMVRHLPAVASLIAALPDESPEVRSNAAWALGRLRDGRALAAISPLMRDSDSRVRRAAVGAVGHFDSSTVVPSLIRVLEHDAEPSVRRTAAWALARLKARSAHAALSAAARRDSDARVREMAVWAIGDIRLVEATPVVAEVLGQDPEARVRESAAWVLGGVRDRAGADALVNALGDSDSRVRGTAAWAVGSSRVDDPRASSALARLLSDQSADVRLKAAWALGELRDVRALPAIRGALRAEQSSQARRALLRAYLRTGGASEDAMTELLSASDPATREMAVRGLVGRGAMDPWPWPWPRPRPFP